jgi:hypothetical protein
VRQLSGSYPVPYHGNVVQGVWGFYQLNVTTENHLLFRLNRTGPHDAQGYVDLIALLQLALLLAYISLETSCRVLWHYILVSINFQPSLNTTKRRYQDSLLNKLRLRDQMFSQELITWAF